MLGGDEGSRAREASSSLLACADLHSPPHQPPACRPGVVQKTHGKFIALHSYLMGGGRGDEDQQPQARTQAVPAAFPYSYVGKRFFTLRVKQWTRTRRGGGIASLGDVQSCPAPCPQPRAGHGLSTGLDATLGEGPAAVPMGHVGSPTAIAASFFIWGLHLPQLRVCTVQWTPKARRISRLAGVPTAPQSHQKLPPHPAVLPGADGETWSCLGAAGLGGG